MAGDPPKNFVILDLRVLKPCACHRSQRHTTCEYHRILQMAPCCGLHHGVVVTCHECYRDMWPTLFYANYTRAFLKEQHRIPEPIRRQYTCVMSRNGLEIDWIEQARVEALPQGDVVCVAQEIYPLMSPDEVERIRPCLAITLMPTPLSYLIVDNGAPHGCKKYYGQQDDHNSVYFYSPTQNKTWKFHLALQFEISHQMGDKVPYNARREDLYFVHMALRWKSYIGTQLHRHLDKWTDAMTDYMFAAFKEVLHREMTNIPCTHLPVLGLNKADGSQLPAAMHDNM